MTSILDQHGKPVPQADIRRAKQRALVSGGVTPYDSADMLSPEMSGWVPWLGSPDTETTPYRDRSVSRIRDLERNDGWASGAVTRMVDLTIGADFRMAAKPDYLSLGKRHGAAFDLAWANEFSAAAEAGWRSWGYDPSRYCDTERTMTAPQMFRLAFRHYMVEGEALMLLPWRPDRRGYGKARYATTLHVIDPDRLSNPMMRMDMKNMRGGVELDEDGVPIAYHIRKAHMNDWFNAGESVTWERIEREEAWGRPRVVHHFDKVRAGQHRPVGGMFTPVLARMRMLAQYDRVELQAAVVNAIFGAYIQSPFDSADVQAALEDNDAAPLSKYQELRADFHRDNRLLAGNVTIPSLFAGETINTVAPSRPSSAFDSFQGTILRNLATSLGLSFETVSGDYRGSSYSSARQALLNEWRTVTRRRVDFGSGCCTPVYVGLLEEMIDRGDVPMPAGAPDFAEIKAELARCKWLGPGRGWVDPTKEPEGSKAKIAAGLSTLELECEEAGGLSWEENLDQLALEKKEAERRGLKLVFDTAQAQQEMAQGDAAAALKQQRETTGPRE